MPTPPGASWSLSEEVIHEARWEAWGSLGVQAEGTGRTKAAGWAAHWMNGLGLNCGE